MFKIGDRVRVGYLQLDDENTNIQLGDFGVIKKDRDYNHDTPTDLYTIKFDKEVIVSSINGNLIDGNYDMFACQLELVERGE